LSPGSGPCFCYTGTVVLEASKETPGFPGRHDVVQKRCRIRPGESRHALAPAETALAVLAPAGGTGAESQSQSLVATPKHCELLEHAVDLRAKLQQRGRCSGIVAIRWFCDTFDGNALLLGRRCAERLQVLRKELHRRVVARHALDELPQIGWRATISRIYPSQQLRGGRVAALRQPRRAHLVDERHHVHDTRRLREFGFGFGFGFAFGFEGVDRVEQLPGLRFRLGFSFGLRLSFGVGFHRL
jgi:hypothetical protein